MPPWKSRVVVLSIALLSKTASAQELPALEVIARTGQPIGDSVLSDFVWDITESQGRVFADYAICGNTCRTLDSALLDFDGDGYLLFLGRRPFGDGDTNAAWLYHDGAIASLASPDDNFAYVQSNPAGEAPTVFEQGFWPWGWGRVNVAPDGTCAVHLRGGGVAGGMAVVGRPGAMRALISTDTASTLPDAYPAQRESWGCSGTVTEY